MESSVGAYPPQGYHPAKVDDKGRLKLPVKFSEYLKREGSTAFITTFDETTARIYAMPVWLAEVAKFESAQGDQYEAFESVNTLAQYYGDTAEVDNQERVLMPTNLRRGLKLEGTTVQVRWIRGHIEVLSEEAMAVKLAAARANKEGNARAVDRLGFK
jgi:MraZ protein